MTRQKEVECSLALGVERHSEQGWGEHELALFPDVAGDGREGAWFGGMPARIHCMRSSFVKP
ncbi:hypothetical protein GCM10025867_46590 (plasmid) [Frondihabitans sucicola]|uniref:Uncharacterized protein n=1 Tax=Frondihabitans sucicola TaxID=1268041 RepID=A0ABN6YA66_9MICO|nr:hypothetical protein GCM10025867_46590 [Frondihabitans sucicola]